MATLESLAMRADSALEKIEAHAQRLANGGLCAPLPRIRRIHQTRELLRAEQLEALERWIATIEVPVLEQAKGKR